MGITRSKSDSVERSFRRGGRTHDWCSKWDRIWRTLLPISSGFSSNRGIVRGRYGNVLGIRSLIERIL